jgi:hypothetical protein
MKCPFRGKSAVILLPTDIRAYEIENLLDDVGQTLNAVPDCIKEECAMWSEEKELCSFHRAANK